MEEAGILLFLDLERTLTHVENGPFFFLVCHRGAGGVFMGGNVGIEKGGGMSFLHECHHYPLIVSSVVID